VIERPADKSPGDEPLFGAAMVDMQCRHCKRKVGFAHQLGKALPDCPRCGKPLGTTPDGVAVAKAAEQLVGEPGWTATWECPNGNCMAANSVAWADSPAQIFCQYCRTECPTKHLKQVGRPARKEPACSSPPSRSQSSAASSSGSSQAPSSSSGPSRTGSPTRSTTTTPSAASGPTSRVVVEVTDQKARELNLKPGTCRKCGRRILFGKTPTGAEVPLQARALQVYVVDKDPAGKLTGVVVHRKAFESHFADCPHADHFRKKAP